MTVSFSSASLTIACWVLCLMGCVSAATTPLVLTSGLVLTWDFDFGWDYFVICCVTLAASRWGGGGGVGVCAGWVVTPHTALLGVPVSFHSCTCLVGLHYRWLLAGSCGGVGVHSWGLSVFLLSCCRRFFARASVCPIWRVGILHVGG